MKPASGTANNNTVCLLQQELCSQQLCLAAACTNLIDADVECEEVESKVLHIAPQNSELTRVLTSSQKARLRSALEVIMEYLLIESSTSEANDASDKVKT